MELSLANGYSPSPGSLESCIASSPMQPPPHPSDAQAGWFNISVDVPIEILDQSMVGVAAGAYCEAACARIHSREPSTVHVPFWPLPQSR